MGSVTGKEQREYYRRLRDRLSPQEILEKSEKIRASIAGLDAFQAASTVLFYYAKGSEVRTFGAIKDALSLGKEVALPVVVEDGVFEIYRITDPDSDLVRGKYGIMEPLIKRCSIVLKDQIDLIFVPGLVFDRRGGRLGWGKGYYDRFLKDVSLLKIGLSFELQVVEQLQVEPQDVLLDMMITEKKIISFHEPKKNDADSLRRR